MFEKGKQLSITFENCGTLLRVNLTTLYIVKKAKRNQRRLVSDTFSSLATIPLNIISAATQTRKILYKMNQTPSV
jgi:hypothetical protein